MDVTRNKELARRFVDEVYGQLSRTAVDELVADDFVSHAWPSTGDSKQFLLAATGRMGRALDQISFTIEDMIAEGDRVAVRVTARARQIGEFMGLPPSGRSYEIGEIHIFRMRDGRIAEHWDQVDTMGMLRQLRGEQG